MAFLVRVSPLFILATRICLGSFMLHKIVFLSALCFSSLSLAQTNDIALPDMGLSADSIMSPQQEQQLGQAVLRQLRRQRVLLEDPLINGYLNALGQNLVSYSDAPSQAFQFFMLPADDINAFAIPGGFIGVHSALFLRTQTEAELASVLAHEIAHVTQRHMVRREEAMKNFSIPALIASLAAIVASASSGDGESARAAMVTSSAAMTQLMINYTRIHEQEADTIGMKTLVGAGFAPHAMPKFFEELQAISRFQAGEVPEFLRTHPVTTNRIADSYARAEQYPPVQPRVENSLFSLMRARTLVLTHKNHSALLMQLQEALKTKNFRDEKAVRYALALTLLELHRPKEAIPHLTWLQENDVDRVPYHLLMAEINRELGQMDQALQVVESALRIYPNDYLLTMTNANLLVSTNRFIDAENILKTLLNKNKLSDYYRVYADVNNKLNRPVGARLALAEFYYLNGNTPLAVTQLEEAQRMTSSGDYYLSAKVDARLKELQIEARRERREQKERQDD